MARTLERVAVEGDAGRLHPGQDGDQRQLDLVEEAVEPFLGQAALERLANGERRQGLEPGARRRVESGHVREDEVELLGDDVGDRLAAERGIEDVGRDLRVEGDRRGRRVRVVGDAPDEQRLDLVPDDRDLEPIEQPPQRRRILRAAGGDRPSVRAREGERQRVPAARPRVVEQQPDPDRRLGGEPRLEGRDPVARVDLDPPRVVDRGGQGGRQVAGRDVRRGRPGRTCRRSTVRGSPRRPRADPDTVSKSSESWSPPPSVAGRFGRGVPQPARARRAGDARRGHGPIGGDAAKHLGRVAGRSRRSSPAGAR